MNILRVGHHGSNANKFEQIPDLQFSVRLKSRSGVNLGVASVVALTLLCIFQAFIGADILCLTLVFISVIVGLIPVFWVRLSTLTSAFFICIVLFFPVSALVLKSLLIQPIESNLFEPRLTFAITTVGIASAVAGALLQALLFWGVRPWVRPQSSLELKMFFNISIVLGLCGVLTSTMSGALGKIGVLINTFMYLSLVIVIQATLTASRGRRSISVPILMIVGIVVSVSIIFNTKQGVIGVGAAWLLTVGLYQGRLSRLQILTSSCCILFTLFVISPAINLTRNIREYATPLEMVFYTFSHMEEVLSNDESAMRDLESSQEDEGRGYAIHYVGKRTAAIDRFAFVAYIDAIVRFVKGNFLGYADVVQNLQEVLPDFVNPGIKAVAGNGDLVLMRFGVFSEDFVSFVTLPVFGEGYAVDGFPGVFLLSLSAFFVLGIGINTILGDIRENTIGIYIIAMQSFVLAGGGLDSYVYFIVRFLPIYLIAYFASNGLAAGSRRRRILGLGKGRL